MSKNIQVELNDKYAEHLALLKQIIPDHEWNEITEDSKMVEALIDSFMSFIQQQAADHEQGCGKWDDCCGWENHSKEDISNDGCGCH